VLALLFARPATHREWQYSQASCRNLARALDTKAVLARVEPEERFIDTRQILRAHLEHFDVDVALKINIGVLNVVTHLPWSVGAPVVSLLNFVLYLATTLAQHAPQVGRSDGGNSHVSTPDARRMPQETGNVCAVVNSCVSCGAPNVVHEEYKHMNEDAQDRNQRFLVGLVTGAVVGAGLMMWFAPGMASEARLRLTDSARSLRKRAARQYQEAGTRVGEAVDDLTKHGLDVRDGLAEAVARGASEVERRATFAKSDRVAGDRQHWPADVPASTTPAR
jgi:gas vesicle protein